MSIFNSTSAAVVVESLNHFTLNLISSSSSTGYLGTNLTSQMSSSIITPIITPFNLASSSTQIQSNPAVDIANSARIEMSNTDLSSSDQIDNPSIYWFAPNDILSDGSSAPGPRLVLNLQPNDTYPWFLYSTTGLSIIETLVMHVGCTYSNCYNYQLINIYKS